MVLTLYGWVHTNIEVIYSNGHSLLSVLFRFRSDMDILINAPIYKPLWNEDCFRMLEKDGCRIMTQIEAEIMNRAIDEKIKEDKEHGHR